MQSRLSWILILFPFVITFGQQSRTALFPDTPVGRRVEAYVKAFNHGDTAMREFFLKYSSEDALQKVPMDQRIDRYRQMHERLGALELRKVNESDKDHLSALFQSGSGNLVNIDFEFEKSAPFGLLGLRIEDAGHDAEMVPADHKKNNADLIHAAERYASDLSGKDEFSGVILIAQHGKPFFEHSYGYADRDKKVPNTIDTKFDIGSINKSFTALAIHKLAAEGKLSLSDPIKKFLPEYPNKDAAQDVTVQELLDMTSGIGDFFGDRYEATPKEHLRTLRAYLPLFADKPLEFKPGTNHRYSNGGYVVLGLIIEEVTGTDYYSYVRKNIFLPAGMSQTDSYEKDSLPAGCAVGYTSRGGSLRSNYPTLPERGSSAGGGYSTVRDLLSYTIALEKGTITTSDDKERGGFGIAGGAPGLNAALEWNPNSGYVIVVMSNFDPPAAEKVARQLRAWLPETE